MSMKISSRIWCRPSASTSSTRWNRIRTRLQPAASVPQRNTWNEPAETVFRYKGDSGAGRYLINRLCEQGFHLPYAYTMRYKNGLAHAFSNTLLLLDVDRKGFDYPVLPFHINCYGGDLIRQRGGTIAPTDVDRNRILPRRLPRRASILDARSAGSWCFTMAHRYRRFGKLGTRLSHPEEQLAIPGPRERSRTAGRAA